MEAIVRVDPSISVMDIHRGLTIDTRVRQSGPPERIDGMTVGIVTVSGPSPHRGEMHPDGDEILYIISGSILLHYDSGIQPMTLSAGEACIVHKGEWHMIECPQGEAQLIHITPGPNGEARF